MRLYYVEYKRIYRNITLNIVPIAFDLYLTYSLVNETDKITT